MLHTTPFLLFDGNCAEAMTFYHKCLGGELTLTKLGDTPIVKCGCQVGMIPAQNPASFSTKVTHKHAFANGSPLV